MKPDRTLAERREKRVARQPADHHKETAKEQRERLLGEIDSALHAIDLAMDEVA